MAVVIVTTGWADSRIEPAPGSSGAHGHNPVTIAAPKEEAGLELDAALKEYTAKAGEESCVFNFLVRNISKSSITINQVRTSCGCTIARLPSQPWVLAPGEGGTITLTVDVRGKSGTLIKTATIDTAEGFKTLTLKIDLPPAGAAAGISDAARARNVEIAAANRQAVFKGDCAKCHLEPVQGKQGAALYTAGCAICHEAEHRAAMVPDLRSLPTQPRQFWETVIMHGKPGTLMPAFGQAEDGPLDAGQISSLINYLVGDFASGRGGKPSPASKAGH